MNVQVTQLKKAYPTSAGPLEVLCGVDLVLKAGQQLAILGPSGSGKSTLLQILGTLDRPTSGAVRFDDTDPFALPEPALADFRRTRIGFVFQEHYLLPQCTALENVLVASLAGGKVLPDDHNRARNLLKSLGLEHRLMHRPGALSGGERQRVAIARALMNRPGLLLCDEPTGNLDAPTADSMGQLLHHIAETSEATLIVVTHSQRLADTFPWRLTMCQGRLQPLS